MQKFVNAVSRFIREEDGVSAIEYGLLAGLIAVMIIGGATAAGKSLQGIFTTISTKLSTAATSAAGAK